MVHWVDLAEESSDVNDPTTGEVVLFDLTPLIYRYQVTSRDGVLWARWLLPPEFVDALSANECVLEVPIRTAMVNR